MVDLIEGRTKSVSNKLPTYAGIFVMFAVEPHTTYIYKWTCQKNTNKKKKLRDISHTNKKPALYKVISDKIVRKNSYKTK